MENRVRKFFIPLFVLLLISSCKTLDTREGEGTLTNIGQRAILANKFNDKVFVCVEPSPDATQDLKVNASGNAGKSGGGSAALNVGQDYVGLRTQSIQLLRDAMFRACEAYLNGGIDEEEYYNLLRRHQKTMMGLLSIESLTGTVRASGSSASLQRMLAAVSGRIMEINRILKEGGATQKQVNQLKEEQKNLQISEGNLSAALAGAGVQEQSSNATALTSEARVAIADVVESIATKLILIPDTGIECFTYLSKEPNSDSEAHQALLDFCNRYFEQEDVPKLYRDDG